MNNFLYIFPNLFFSKTNTVKIILLIFSITFLIVFYYIIIYITLKNNFTKEKEIYKYVWTYFVYDCTCL